MSTSSPGWRALAASALEVYQLERLVGKYAATEPRCLILRLFAPERFSQRGQSAVCGIAGYCDFSPGFDPQSGERTLRRMTQALHRRGPDDQGVALLNSHDGHVGFGHRRLSIIDLSVHGHQPMFARGEQYAITFNGEIYNHKELRAELEAEGIAFRSDSDTEVVLEALIHWGIEAVHRLIGMFALAYYDGPRGQVYLLRDRAGVKPLYYYWKNQRLLFASELKSLHEHEAFSRDLNLGALDLYLRHGFVPEPHCIFADTYKLRSGHYLVLDLARRSLRQERYWNVLDSYNAPRFDLSDDEAESELEALFRSAFAYRMVSDVPVGLFLSGGYDSSCVAALLQQEMSRPLRTFTIGFEDPAHDEAPAAKAIAQQLGTEHTEHYCSERDALAIVPSLPEVYDEPFGDSSAIPTLLVSEIARRDVTVALSADGGDELFAGYTRYTRHLSFFERLAGMPTGLRKAVSHWVPALSRIPIVRDSHNIDGRAELVHRLLGESDPGSLFRHKSELRFFTDRELSLILPQRPPALPSNYDHFSLLADHNDGLARMLAVDYQTYLVDDILTKVDRATMSVGLEGREPLLDHRIIEFVARLPSHFKYRDGNQKHILKKIVHKHLPERLVDRPKSGFSAPLDAWLKNDLRALLLDSLSRDRLKQGDIFDPNPVVELRDRFLAGRGVATDKIWFLLCFQLWHERWIG